MDNFGLADLGYVILGILIVGIGLPLAWGFVQQKLEQRRVVSTGHTIVVQKPVQSVQKLPQPTTIIQQSVPTMRILDWTAKERGFTVISGAPGDGKTQSSIALMVNDIARGLQVIWLNPHLTLYHPEDQTTDIRSLSEHFEHIREYTQIGAALKEAHRIVHERMPLYHQGEDVGHDIVLYIDEWPAIVEVCGDEATKFVRAILREGRKCRMWIVLATQDAQVETLGLKSGVRNTFHIRLVGNVEAATWSALIGVGIPKPTQRLEHGYWHLAGRQSGIAHIVRPTIFDIQRIAQQTPHMYNPLVTCADETTEPIVNDKPINELTLVKQWLEADPSLSRRETARRLYKVRGGTDTEYSGDGPLYYEAVELYNKARESVDQSTFIGAT